MSPARALVPGAAALAAASGVAAILAPGGSPASHLAAGVATAHRAFVAERAQALANAPTTPVAVTDRYMYDLIADPDGSLRYASWGDSDRRLPSVSGTETASGELIPPTTLIAGRRDYDTGKPVLTPTGATVIYDAAKGGIGSNHNQQTARTVALDGTVTDQVIQTPGLPLQVNEVDAGEGSVAVGGYEKHGNKYKTVLIYRAAGATSFSKPTEIPSTDQPGFKSSTSTYQFRFATDGSAVLLDQPEGPISFRRIGDSGTVGPAIRFGKRGIDTFSIDYAIAPNGDVVVAEIEPISRSSNTLALYVATLPAGGTAFTTPKRIDTLGRDSETYVSLAVAADGQVSTLVESPRKLRFYEGAPNALKRTKTRPVNGPDFGQVIATADGGVAAIWTAYTGRGRTRGLYVSERTAGGAWPKATRLKTGKGIEDDPGVSVMQAVALPSRGVALGYTAGRNYLLQRVLP
jgi:hypothetical protein